MYYGLNTVRYEIFGDVPLRLNEDLRNAVAFLGYVTYESDKQTVFHPGGTGFFLWYDNVTYLVTARHVAESIEPPFALRASDRDGNPILINDIDHAGWFYHTDPNVDLAVVVGVPDGAMSISGDTLLTRALAVERNVGVGDEAYIVGLYRLLRGKNRNRPIVHSGAVAMMPNDEPIPQRDRRTGKVKDVHCYLIEAQTLEGLSGSPVFIRHVWKMPEAGNRQTGMLLGDAFLAGVWSGAWDAPPGEVLSLERPEAKRVPVGMGLAVSSFHLIELLEQPEVIEHRKRRLAEGLTANQDVDIQRPERQEPRTKADNPQHKEDFNRLLNAAASDRKEGSET
ncbi:serine protease [Thalassospiraceae bacterium LMO-JJ14]|nr:serine protease [Thalassospiraceae bacterium LMO-JJ14]